MGETTDFVFTKIAPKIWEVISGNIFLSMSTILGLIAAVMSLQNALKK